MKLIVKRIGFSSGIPQVIIDDSVAEALGVKPHDRLLVKYRGKEIVAEVNVAKEVPSSSILVNEEVWGGLELQEGAEVEVLACEPPLSLRYIRDRLKGIRLGYDEIKTIVKDIVAGRLTEIELTAFIVSYHNDKMSVDEAYYFSRAMVETGRVLGLDRKPILDKHSIGGIPGDKTTLLVVPIIAALGYTIPKTSSRAITSPAGTADRAEVLMPVDLSVEEMKEAVLKTNGCIVWGGALQLAPADDKIIKIEYPLSIDPFFIPSIMAKKKSVGATHVVVDMPIGMGAKIKNEEEAYYTAREFIEVGKRLGINVRCALTFGEQPLGYTAGPSLEAREALQALRSIGPKDLIDKATGIAGLLLEMVGLQGGKAIALEALKSGKAERKLREIIEAQGGDPNVSVEDIPIGSKKFILRADKEGNVIRVDNRIIAHLARLAGAPRDKGAGVVLYAKLGDKVNEGDPILEVRAEIGSKLRIVEKYLENVKPISIGRIHEQMLLKSISVSPVVGGEIYIIR
ncbi:MAG: AMP phosphorylase [Thermoproteales archaeon]|nr:AMP phosphorylase [Thermoproteales archaeon]RLE65507.1 MAG: AMP phosphorylase [Thermoprotei archaeon]